MKIFNAIGIGLGIISWYAVITMTSDLLAGSLDSVVGSMGV